MQEHNRDPRVTGRPNDFAFRFEYHAGSVQPPDYYEYIIEIAPDGSGEIRYLFGREADHPEEYVGIFNPDDDALERVYRVMRGAGLLEPTWQPPRRKNNAGGNQARLEVTCAGNCYEAMLLEDEDQAPLLEAITEVIAALVPDKTWEKIRKQKNSG